MKPILIATPRSGSTIIGEQIGNLAEQWWGYKNYLHEYFSVSPYYKSEISKVGRMLFFEYMGPADGEWCRNPSAERLARRKLLEENTKYMLKVMPGNFKEEWMVPWIKENYNEVIFLDRRNREAQLLSWMAYRTVKVSHWHRDSENRIQIIDYRPEYVDEFVDMVKKFKEVKSQFENVKTLYYEDWVDGGRDQRTLIKLLGWNNEPFIKMITTTQSTPYTANPENLITNKFDWNEARPGIMKRLMDLDT